MNYDNTKDWVRIVDDFRRLINEVETIKNNAEEDIREADQAFGDIRHYCELEYPTDRANRTKVCKLINEYSIKRRKAKNALFLIKPLVDFYEQNRKIVSSIGKCANEMSAYNKRIESEKYYTPRVLKDLFNK